MGLAQLMQRPRNWDLADQAISDNFRFSFRRFIYF